MLLGTNGTITVSYNCRTSTDKLTLGRAGFLLTTETPNFKGTALDIVMLKGQQIICEPMYAASAICRMTESIKDT